MLYTKNIAAAAAAILSLALLTTGCGPSEPTMELTVTPADASVSVDGYLHPGGSPHTIVFKSPGKYKLDVEKPGFKSVEMMINMGQGESASQLVELVPDNMQIATPPDVPPPHIPPPDIPTGPSDPPLIATGGFTLNITSSPSAAKVTLREPGNPNLRQAGSTPVTVNLSGVGATEVIVSKRGYVEHRRLVVAPANGGAVNLNVMLEKKRNNNPGPQLPPPLIQDPPIITDPGAHGFISVNTNPWCAVSVDGKAVGNTPLVNFKVSAGYHTVTMENRDLGKRRKKSVNVRPGEHVRLMESL